MTAARILIRALCLVALPGVSQYGVAQHGAVQAAQERTMFPAVRGMHQMIGAGNSMEVEAGYRMLEQGGNAIDAGAAAILAATVTEQDHIGLGGEAPLMIKMAGKPVVVINAVGVAPSKATPEFFAHRHAEPFESSQFPPIPSAGIISAITPGTVDGILLALEKFGTMSLRKSSSPPSSAPMRSPLPKF